MALSDLHGHRGIGDVAKVSNRTHDISANSAIDLQPSLAVVSGYGEANVPRESAVLFSIKVGPSRSRWAADAASLVANIKMIPNLDSSSLWSERRAGANGGGMASMSVFRAGNA